MTETKFGLSEEAELRKAISEEALAIFTDTDGFAGAELTIGGDEMEIAGALLDRWDLDPEAYLRANPVEFTVPVKVQVLLDEDDRVYYRLTFQGAAS